MQQRLISAGLFTATLLLLNGCGLIYTNVHLPYEYRSATPADVHSDKTDPDVYGQSCSTSLLYMVYWGDSGYSAVTKAALAPYPNTTLYDAKLDFKVQSYVLGLYTKTCIIVTGKAAKS